MSSDREYTVQHLIEEDILFPIDDGNHGGIHPKMSDYVSEGIPFLMASDLLNSRADLKGCAFLSSDQAESLRKGFARNGDVLLTHKGTVGRTAILNGCDEKGAILSPQVTYYRVKDRSKLNPDYLKWYFDSNQFQLLFSTWAGAGSTRAYLGITAQRDLPVLLPSIERQNAIAHILGTLDDKIELNRKTNETLEAMAKALFKSWFVDFDPVRAKAEGRPTGLPAEINDLFPDSFEDSELGEILSGWKVGCLSDCCEITMGQSPPGDTYNDEGDGLPFYQGKTDFGFRFPGRRIYCSSHTRQASIGATLISVRAPVGSANIAREVCSIGRGIAALKSRQSADSFIYYLIGTLQGVFESYNSEGTVFGAINRKDLASIQVVAPSTEAVAAFNSQLD